MLALVNGRLIDGTGSPPRDGITIWMEDGRINEICESGQVKLPAGAPIIDLEGRTLLPGLIDAHVHISSPGLAQLNAPGQSLPPDLRAYALAVVSRALLEGGITTVRDCGSYGHSLFTLREAIKLGLCVGPRLVLCGQIVAATSPGGKLFPGMYREADGPEEMRKAVREQIRQGCDFIKLMATGALTVPGEDVNPAQITTEEIRAVVQEAHRAGQKVAAHAEGLDGIRIAVEAAVNTIEHGEMGYKSPELLEKMAAQGIILVPTLCVFELVIDPQYKFPSWMVERAKMLRDCAFKTVEAARRFGVSLAMGADAGPHGRNARELVRMVEAGLSPQQGIISATRVAARACGLEDTIGTLLPGKAADLLVIDGDPLKDISLFMKPDKFWLVMQAGKVVAGSLLRCSREPWQFYRATAQNCG